MLKDLKNQPSWIKWTVGVGAVVLVIALLVPEEKKDKSAAKKRPPPAAPVTLTARAAESVKARTVVVRGTVDPPTAKVTVDEVPAKVRDGRFRARTPLAIVGGNEVLVQATLTGRRAADKTLDVTRQRSAAELAAIRERTRRARVARQQRKIRAAQAFKDAATTIPYKQLVKSPDRYVGDKVKFTGQVFQIQEEEGVGGVMLLAVTDEGYGIWTDNVWVDYTGGVKSAEEDVLTVYGVIKGAKQYDTQIGGSTYVPQMTARYFDE